MIDFEALKRDIIQTPVAEWGEQFEQAVKARFKTYTHGELEDWTKMMSRLPKVSPSTLDFRDGVSIGRHEDIAKQLDEQGIKEFIEDLIKLHPWRKGPFNLFDIHIDTEWRSDWKWDRLKSHISPLKNRAILDVGCGNAYHGWRMLGEEAKLVLGIDPSQKFLAQFSIFKHFAGEHPIHLLPIGIEDMPYEDTKIGFDTVFSMGVLYHRKSPINHLLELKSLLGRKGELVLETLVIDGDEDQVLVPSGRYAQMRNVWFLPSTLALEKWMKKCGFKNVRTVDVNQTSLDEQRATDWMSFHSLENYLDPVDQNKTVEGYPAPKRAIVIAEN